MVIFDTFYRSSASVTPDKYECDSDDEAYIFAKSEFL